MRIFFLDWRSLGNIDILRAVDSLNSKGYEIEIYSYPFDNHIEDDDKGQLLTLEEDIKKYAPSFVFSFNYFPIVSKACQTLGIKYVSWVYDSPAIRLFSYTLINSCNYVFVFDTQIRDLFVSQGIKNVYYLPMASAASRYDELTDEKKSKKYTADISFVGSLYSEDHNYYDDIYYKLSDYAKGYLDGLIKSQINIYGQDVVEKSLTKPLIKEMVDVLGAKPSYDSVATYEYIYSNYVINRKITSLERTEILKEVGKIYELALYTKDNSFAYGKIKNYGEVDYYSEMPYVFKNTKINLNITLRSIQRGIPLRIMDVFGCKGFLLTNYQEDLSRFFVPGEDYVYYEDRNDLMDKIKYYLSNDAERNAIAENAYKKVHSEHSYEQRIEEILSIVDA